jgi:hypothetical protein
VNAYLAVSLGAREGELFGIAAEDFDPDGEKIVRIRRQVGWIVPVFLFVFVFVFVFALPKNDCERIIPCPNGVPCPNGILKSSGGTSSRGPLLHAALGEKPGAGCRQRGFSRAGRGRATCRRKTRPRAQDQDLRVLGGVTAGQQRQPVS